MSDMKQEMMQQAAAELLIWLKTAGEAVGEQAPLLADEIARFGAAYHPVLAVAGVALIAIAWFGGRGLLRKIEKLDDYDKEMSQMFTVGFGLIAGVGGCIIAVSNTIWMLEAIFAPRLYVIETVMGMLK